MGRAVIALLVAMVVLIAPVAAESEPRYEAACPTGSAQVVLDPGHGGDDPGALFPKWGLYEKTLTLEIARRVEAILEGEYGYTVALTREDNATALGNTERGEIANACGAEVFVEIHLNAAWDRSADRAQTFWAERQKDLAFSMVMNDSLASLGIPTWEVERFDNGGLIRAKMPSVLVESVFLTNDLEAMDLANGTRQESISQAIAGGIDTWLTLTGGR